MVIAAETIIKSTKSVARKVFGITIFPKLIIGSGANEAIIILFFILDIRVSQVKKKIIGLVSCHARPGRASSSRFHEDKFFNKSFQSGFIFSIRASLHGHLTITRDRWQ